MGLSLSPGFKSSDAALDRFDALLRDASSLNQGAISQLYSRLDEVREEASRGRESWTSVDASLDTISQAFEEQLVAGHFMAREPGAEDSPSNSVATRRSSSDTKDEVPTSPGFATELMMLGLTGNDGSLLKPWPLTSGSADTGNVSAAREGGPADSIARLRSHKSMSDLHRLTPPLTQDGVGTASNPVRRARADTLTDIGSRGGTSRQLPETGTEGEGKRARLKAWLKRTFLPERLPRSPVQRVEEPPSSLTTLVERDENVAISSAPLHPSYRVLATVGKDLARIDECMSSVRISTISMTLSRLFTNLVLVRQAEKLIASAHRAIVRVERKMRRALQVRSHSTFKGMVLDRSWGSQARRKLIHDHRRTRSNAPKVDDVLAEQKGRYQPSPPLRLIIPPGRTESPVTSPTQSPTTTRSTASSVSSLASIGKESDGTETETDTELLKRLYVKKVMGRFERACEGLEKADIWLKIVKKVLEDVERRGLDEMM